LGTASERNHDYLRSIGAEPVTYGEGLAERVRELVPDGVDAALDYVGGQSLEMSPQVVKNPERIVSVVDPATVKAVGGQYAFVRPDPRHLAELATLVDEGVIRIELARTFPLAEAADAQRLVEEGHVRGKVAISVP
jgi:NADPH:quinone reductase-like Zn-dependent oxidoreductase